MGGYCKIVVCGYVGSDPVTRYSGNGTKVVNFSIATSEKYTDSSGNKAEKTQWHQCVVFGKTADIAEQYVLKGSVILIDGKPDTEEWTDKSGNKRTAQKIIVSNLTLVSRPEGRQPTACEPQSPAPARAPQKQAQQKPANDFDDDDIPF